MSFGNFDSMFGDDWMDSFRQNIPTNPFPNGNKWNNSPFTFNYNTIVNGKTWNFPNLDAETYNYVISQVTRGVPVEKLYAEVYPNNDNKPNPVAPIPDPVRPKPDPVPQTDGEKPDEVGDKEDLQNIKKNMDPDCDFDDSTFKSNNQ